MRRPLSLVSAVLLVGAAAAVSAPAASAHDQAKPRMTVVASHLANPRGLAATEDGVLVAESGDGGTTCLPAPIDACAGLTGAISLVTHGKVTRIRRGLISVSGPGGAFAGGVSAVSEDDERIVAVMAANTFSIPPGFPPALVAKAKAQLGQLIAGREHGRLVPVAGVGDFDYQWTKDHASLQPDQFPDSNPNGVLLTGRWAWVADAGANSLTVVGPRGQIRHVAYFQVPKGSPTDAVPTCVAQGPDHALYVGELLGGSFAPGHARVWRVWFSHGRVHKAVWATGFTTIQGCGFDRRGNFYATEFQVAGLGEDPSASPLGALVRVARNGHRTVLGMGSLFFPSGFAAGRDGSVYVSNCSVAPSTGFGPCPAGGQLVRFSG